VLLGYCLFEADFVVSSSTKSIFVGFERIHIDVCVVEYFLTSIIYACIVSRGFSRANELLKTGSFCSYCFFSRKSIESTAGITTLEEFRYAIRFLNNSNFLAISISAASFLSCVFLLISSLSSSRISQVWWIMLLVDSVISLTRLLTAFNFFYILSGESMLWIDFPSSLAWITSLISKNFCPMSTSWGFSRQRFFFSSFYFYWLP